MGIEVTNIPKVRVNNAIQPIGSNISPRNITPKIVPTPGTAAIMLEVILDPTVRAAYPIRRRPRNVGTSPWNNACRSMSLSVAFDSPDGKKKYQIGT